MLAREEDGAHDLCMTALAADKVVYAHAFGGHMPDVLP